MDTEEEQKKRISAYEIGMDLSEMSVDEIDEMITALKSEIERLESTMKEKAAHLSAAEALFNK